MAGSLSRGRTYTLETNQGPNTLQGGFVGFDRVVWKAQALETPDGPSVIFRHVSPDGDEGFPGTLNVRVTYTLTNGNELRIDYEGTSDKVTPVNMTNHCFFNLACRGDVLGHILQLNARKYTPTGPGMIPTGEVADVAGGPLDFTKPKPIGRDIKMLPGGGQAYDNNFVIDGGGRDLVPSGARLRASRRTHDGSLYGPACRAALHVQFIRRARRQAQLGLPAARRIVPGNPALSGFR
jgi:aldose 1-epimerase